MIMAPIDIVWVSFVTAMTVLSGEKASGEFLIQQGRLVADNVEGVIVKGRGTGSWKRRQRKSSRSSLTS
jgi:hypothetical protein